MTALELLLWSGCPSHEKARALAREILTDVGRPDEAAAEVWIETEEEARARRFVGSPTFRWAGEELVAPADDDVFGLTCRLYRRRDGRASPLPDPDDLREALSARSGG